MSHELSKLTMIDSCVSSCVFIKKTAKGTAFANRVTRQRSRKGHSSVSCVGHETINLVAGVHDGLASRGAPHERPMLDCQENNGKELDVILGSGVFFVATEPSKTVFEREARWNSIRCHKQRSNEQRRQECMLDLESLALRRETRWTEMNRRCTSEFPRAR